MTNEEIVEKIQEGADPDKYMLMLWEQNEAFVKHVIKITFGSQINKEDYKELMQEGFIALIEQAHNYPLDCDVAFSTYCFYRIRRHLIRYVDNCCCGIKLSPYIKQKIIKYNRFIKEYSTEHEKRPPDELIMSTLELTDKSYLFLLKVVHFMNVRSLDEEISPDDDSKTLAELVDIGIDIADLAYRPVWLEELHKALEEALAILDCKTQALIRASYYDRIRFDDVSVLFGYANGDSVRCIINEGFRKIRRSKYAKNLILFMHEGYQPHKEKDIPPYDQDLGSGWDD